MTLVPSPRLLLLKSTVSLAIRFGIVYFLAGPFSDSADFGERTDEATEALHRLLTSPCVPVGFAS